MSRQKLSEFCAKKIFNPHNAGLRVTASSPDETGTLPPSNSFVVKVDQGIKKRGKQGLIRLNVPGNKVPQAIKELTNQGFDQFLVEKMVSHKPEDEHYLCLERTRGGIAISYSPHGGIDVESGSTLIKTTIYPQNPTPLSDSTITKLVETMNQQHISLAEFNPFLIKDKQFIPLDAAILVDSAGQHFADGWNESDVMESSAKSKEEQIIASLDQSSPAAFSFRILNPNGSMWLLLSGGGASITIADQAHAAGKGTLIANYGEYSGGPTTEESYLYTKELLSSLLKSNASKKALVIAGGVANFTDVQKTFRGVIQALKEVSPQLKKAKVKVFVRRGGPNETTGLAEMDTFLTQLGLNGGVEGSSVVVTNAIDRALEYVS